MKTFIILLILCGVALTIAPTATDTINATTPNKLAELNTRRLGVPGFIKSALKGAANFFVGMMIDCLFSYAAAKLPTLPMMKNIVKGAAGAKEKLKGVINKAIGGLIDKLRRIRRMRLRRMGFWGKIGGAFKKVGKAVGKVAKKVGKGVKKAAKKVGKAVKKVAKKVAKGVKKAAVVVGKGVKKAAVVAGKGVAIAAVVTGKGVAKGAVETGKGVKKAAVATGKGVKKAAVVAGKGIAKGAVVAGKGIVKGAVVAGKVIGKAVVVVAKTALQVVKAIDGLTGHMLSKALIKVACPYITKMVCEGLSSLLKAMGFIMGIPPCVEENIAKGCVQLVRKVMGRHRLLRRLGYLRAAF